MTTTLRPAVPSDAPTLSAIAISAKSYWGYDQAFIEACRQDLSLSPDEVSNGTYIVAEQDGEIAGFYQVHGTPPAGILGHMWVTPSKIGRGTGRVLWADALKTAQRNGFEHIEIDADPHAEGFYIRMGARKIGEVESSVIPGRMLPLMRVDVAPKQ